MSNVWNPPRIDSRFENTSCLCDPRSHKTSLWAFGDTASGGGRGGFDDFPPMLLRYLCRASFVWLAVTYGMVFREYLETISLELPFCDFDVFPLIHYLLDRLLHLYVESKFQILFEMKWHGRIFRPLLLVAFFLPRMDSSSLNHQHKPMLFIFFY